MSTSSLLTRGAMNGGSGGIDDQSAYHHITRGFKGLSMSHSMSSPLIQGTHINESSRHTYLAEDYHPSVEDSINNHYLQENNLCINNHLNNVHSSSGQLEMMAPNGHHDHPQSQGLNSITSALPSAMDDPFSGNNTRRSANMTETVTVPSSEHVAEIVGRQGCKIKGLRSQTNTYIKTPVRGAEPVFVVTGRKEDVAQAKQQIISAANHFSSIRASRRSGSCSTTGPQASNYSSGTSSPTSTPGHTTMQVPVPYKVVGLVVGPKGATIKRIQQATSTYIVTPGRDKEPVFEVTGLPENVAKAKEEIEKHIASRTGTDNNSDLQIDDFQVNGIDHGYHDQNKEPGSTTSTSSYNHYGNNIVNHHDNLPPLSSLGVGAPSGSMYHQSMQPASSHQSGSIVGNHITSATSSAMSISEYSVLPPIQQYSQFNHSGSSAGDYKPGTEYDADEGFGTSGSAASVYDPTAAFWSDPGVYGVQRSNSISVSGARILPPGEDGPHPRTRRTNSDPLAAAFQRIDAAFSSSSPASSQGSTSPVTGRRNRSPPRRSAVGTAVGSVVTSRCCKLCGSREVTAALVPCGHNTFCIHCATKLCQRELEHRRCPICGEVPEQAILIRN